MCSIYDTMYGKYLDNILSFYVATFFNGIVLLMADKNLIIRLFGFATS